VGRKRETQVRHKASLCRRFFLPPVDALIDLVVGYRLRSQIQVRLDFDTTTNRRITAAPKDDPRVGDMRGGCESTPM